MKWKLMKWNKRNEVQLGRIKMSLLANDIIVYVENPKESKVTKKETLGTNTQLWQDFRIQI